MDIITTRPTASRRRLSALLAGACVAVASFAAYAKTHQALDGLHEIKATETVFIDRLYDNSKKSDDIKTFALSFPRQDERVFTFDLNDHLVATFDHGQATIRRRAANPASEGDVLFTETWGNRVAHVSVAFEVTSNNIDSIQLVGTDGDHNYVTSSPIYTATSGDATGASPGDLPNILSIDNRADLGTLRIGQVSFAMRKNEVLRGKRSIHGYQLECLFPLMAIANKLLNTPCDLIKNVLTHVAGDEGSRAGTGKGISMPEAKELEWSLANLTLTHGRDPYAGHAASVSCNVPLGNVFSNRKKRSAGDDCVFMVLDVLTPYLILMDYDFNPTVFNRVIRNILRSGFTGIVGGTDQVHNELINAVRSAQQQANEAGGRAMHALEQDLRTASSLYSASVTFSDVVLPAPNPANAIGEYEMQLSGMSVDSFREAYPEVRPRTWSNDHWEPTDDAFTVEVMRDLQTDQIADIQSQLLSWFPVQQDVVPRTADNNDWLNGEGISRNFYLDLNDRRNTHVVVAVRHRGRIVSLLLANVYQNALRAEVEFSVSAPASLLRPYSAQAIRGAGQRALQAFIEYALSQNIRVIGATAATTTSARVKQRLGFRSTDEL
ncbi:acetolactate synthase regulatory subunit [Luteibacter sp. Sphag1AF]|uniref:hypothetical protein n=1 Tax=Luteibacter sp. Sphag1AF TaxID=2587031 RepID=UPI00160D00DF|nr:hypothetical protein [Luteibacter sp. Sphag1AF]MBB3226607.1 acetolactate synthase regulatory subunit [Luteibacter sp. Sphag1AF]